MERNGAVEGSRGGRGGAAYGTGAALRLEILLQDCQFECDATVVSEHHADKFVAGMQVGGVGLGRTLVYGRTSRRAASSDTR